jgi:hypothetical protein
MATDPTRLRASYADARGLATVPLVLADLRTAAVACSLSAAAFALGTVLSPSLH